MQPKRVRQGRVLAIAAGFLFLGTSASFAQCMAGSRGMASAGTGMMGGPRMMGMGATGTMASTGGTNMMSLQQAMQMAQMAQQMRTMQIDRLRMLEAQRNRRTAQNSRNRRTANGQLTANFTLGQKPNLEPNENSSLPQTAPATGRTLRNRRAAANRTN